MVTIIKRKDAAAAAQAGQLTIGQETDKLLEMQKIALQQEQLRYMETLRTGKPAVDPIQAALRHLELARAAIIRLEPIIQSQSPQVEAVREPEPKPKEEPKKEEGK